VDRQYRRGLIFSYKPPGGTTNRLSPKFYKGAVLGKELNYKLEYREAGEKKIIEIKIDFLSRGIARDFDNLNSQQEKISEKWHKILDNETIIASYKIEKPEGYKQEIKKLNDETDFLKKEILSFKKDDFIQQQHDLIQAILKDNGVKTPLLLTADFWEYNVDVQDMMNFLVAVIYKDIDLKKKQ
jgi:hypothetical protein